jgi:HEAT repeat protein
MIRFPCPSCDTSLKTADEKAGTHILCPACGDRVPVPAGRGTAGKKPALRDTRHDDEDDEALERPSSKAGLYIGLGAAACVLVAGVGIVVGMSVLGGDNGADTKKDSSTPVADAPNKPPARVGLVSSSTTGNGTVQNPLPEPSKPADKGATTQAASSDAKTAPVPDSTSKPAAEKSGTAVAANPTPQPSSAPELTADASFNAEQVYSRLLKSVTWVVLVVNGRAIGSGSGALVDKTNRLVLTNYHVIDEVLARRCQAIVVFPEYDSKSDKLISEEKHYMDEIKKNQAYESWVVHKDSKRDLALIQINGLPERVMELPLAVRSPAVGQKVLSVGNPKATTLGTLWVMTPGDVRQVYHNKWQTGPTPTDMHEADVVLTNSQTNPGDSGGPLVNGRTQLVAVVHGGRRDANSLSMFIDVGEVRAFMNEYYKDHNMKLLPEKAEASLVESTASGDVRGLMKHLADASAATKALAAKRLGQMGPDARQAVTPLVNALKDADPDVRKNAAEALVEIGSLTQSHLPTLLEAAKDTDKDVQVAAIGAIKTMGGNGEPAIPVLREVLQHKEETVRKAAANTLANLGPAAKASVPDLAVALKDSSPGVRSTAAQALGRMGPDAAPALKELGEAIKDNQLEVQLNALSAIESLGSDAAPLLPALEKALIVKNKEVRLRAIAALGGMGSAAKPLVPNIIDAMSVEDFVQPVKDALKKIGNDAIKPLIRALSSPDAKIRQGAAFTLGQFGQDAKDALPRLNQLAQSDKDQRVRAAATLARINIMRKKP